MQTINFTVDAALLQELGERLIGKPHIALAELIKNSYDADAFSCTVTFGNDSIEIADDGHGMSFDEFRSFWARIGTTHKLEDGVSRELHRPLTGSKGVGRLAVQFLAREMELRTVAKGAEHQTLHALVDWTTITRGRDLNTVEIAWQTQQQGSSFPYGATSGTIITLKGLRDKWDADRLQELGEELWSLRSPFRRRHASPTTRTAEDFDVSVVAPEIEDAQQKFDAHINALRTNWKARIRGKLRNGRRGHPASVVVEFKEGYPAKAPAEKFEHSVSLPISDSSDALLDRVDFEILVFKLEGRQAGGVLVSELRDYLTRFGNVAIYDAGFRLPYYGMAHDWLDIAADQAARTSISLLLPASLRIGQRYMLDLPDARRLFGAVDISTSHERSVAESASETPGKYLQLQPGRDRLHDNEAHRQLRDLVRFSIDFYANRYRLREARRVEQVRTVERATTKQARVLEVLEENKASIPQNVFSEVRREVSDALKTSKVEEEEQDRRAALLAPLASAGMAALALSHELSRERRLLKSAIQQLSALAVEHELTELQDVLASLNEAHDRLQNLQGLFVPLLSDEDKSALHRLKVKPVVEQTVNAVKTIMPGVQFEIEAIPDDLRFPIGSAAEWNALIQNALTNAWNAMLQTPHPLICIEGGQRSRSTEFLRISDNGRGLGVAVDQADKLFEPFERLLELDPDHASIAIGGQGLGLTICRMIARQRRADICFVSPPEGYSTCLEVSWRA
ncbi:ATP-binding protein [Pelagibacterium halotolerans]|uniref:ATP-binding protein n=1 Tax=Pelagibacterium halotolerans TaxID=531813 RepID=UPI00384F9911